MKITGLQTNHLTNPLGYDIRTPRVSFQVTDTEAKKAEAVRILAALDEDFEEIVYDSGKSSGIQTIGTDLNIQLRPRTRYYWKAEVWGDNGEHAISDTAWFETAKMEEPWEGKWIGTTKLKDINPMLVKEFTTEKAYKKARIYVTGLGLYEMYLDGERVGNEYLTPGCTDYNQWIQYQTYEVEIKSGSHRLEVFLADGWYMGRFGLDHAKNNYGDQHKMILELVMQDGKGNEDRIFSDESWEVAAGDVVFSNIYDGETYVPTSNQSARYGAEILDGPTNRLTARYGQPVIIKEEIKPVEIIHTPAGETVIDMGQNMAGFLGFYVDEPKGARIYMQFG
ncbi:MAG: family 78 glycoside hydrolase catalytic domain, partial [Lachnospiraceae bacterium]|nr:family 78 glycoside hydrolase catalytic domain [Lachnospiraceae bacterium]